MRLGTSASVVTARILAHANAEPKRMRVKAFAFAERTPPKEIQLWNAGDNPTDYGIHKWTERSVATVMGRYEERGNPLLIDVEHLGAKNEEDDEPTVIGGYARLELRAGAPWLVFDWSKYAVEQIASGERRFLSPEYDVDRTTGEIVALYRVSLVADPGTHRARMLAAAAINASKQENGMDPKLAAIMAILSSVADPAAAIDAIKSLVASLDGGGGDAPAAPAAGEQTAAPGDKPGDAPGDAPDKDKPVAAAAPTAPAAVAPVAPAAPAAPVAPVAAAAAAPTTPAAPTTEIVTAAAKAAVVQIESAQRDHLLLTHGDRLDPSIRRWASSQPLAVVQGLINAAPAKQAPAGRVTATRGEGHGTQPDPKGLQGEELEQLQRAMGTFKASSLEPHKKADGTLVIPTVPPSQVRARKLAAAATTTTAPAAGKDGK